MNKIIVEVSIGELFDKISILEIKKDKIKDAEKLKFISDEHSILKNQLDQNKQANFVRMTGSGSAIIMYFNSNKFAKNALKIYKRKLNNCLCIVTKII